jgi:carbon-monoxide dehydrogenase medium subunit
VTLSFREPATLDEACSILAGDEWGARAISGGTAVVLMMRQGLIAPTTLVSLNNLEGLRGIDLSSDGLRVGARTTLTGIASSAQVRSLAPSLAEACAKVGNVRVRNLGTIGGNVAEADYASDPPAVLVSLDAVCTVVGPVRTRLVPVADLITGFYTTSLEPGEIITGVTIPLFRDANVRFTYHRYVSGSSEDRPCVGVATAAEFDQGRVKDLRVVVGAVAPVPQRFDNIAREAIGTALDAVTRDHIAGAYAAAIDPIEDARGSVWYRKRMVEVFVRKGLEGLVAP